MNKLKFKKVSFNNRARKLLFRYLSGQSVSVHYSSLSIKNNIKRAWVDEETRKQSIGFEFEDGKIDYIPYDQPLAISKDPEFLLRTHIETIIAFIKETLSERRISKKYLAEQLKTSDNQIQRLLNPALLNKNLEQLYKIASLIGLEFNLKLHKAA
jgi:hypothetical protein